MKAGNKGERMGDNNSRDSGDCHCFSGYDYMSDDVCRCNTTCCETTSQYAQNTKTNKEKEEKNNE